MSEITLKPWQQKASSTIVDRFVEFQEERPSFRAGGQEQRFPFYQALGSLPASGKTAMLADAVNGISAHLAPQPVVLWLSKARVVVDQSLANLLPSGKYGHLLGDCTVKPLADYDPQEVWETDKKLLYFATVGSFNQEDREKSKLRVFNSSVDLFGAEGNTIWESLKRRTALVDGDEVRRPLVVGYDEGHNLTDSQMALLLELEPVALLVASATMVLPASLNSLLNKLTTLNEDWTEKLVTNVDATEVAGSGLIKGNIDLAGYKTTMEDAVSALLERKKDAEAAAEGCAPWLIPKAIYVCQTNVSANGAQGKEDPKRSFAQREAPPILIWRYLVEERGIDPAKIAVYCSLEVDKQFPLPESFVLYKGGEKDYERFAASSYEHVIFNQSLQEGWDDPECYFAYIDKSMGSKTQVEQIVGRLLRQPRPDESLPEAILNTAHFYVRVDDAGTFEHVVSNVRDRLASDKVDIRITAIKPGVAPPTELEAKVAKRVPQVVREAGRAREEIAKVMKDLVDHRGGGPSTVSDGQRAVAQVRVGDKDGKVEWAWEDYKGSSLVTARWVFESTIKKRFTEALQSVNSSDERLDARIQFDSPAYRDIQDTAQKVVQAYIDNIEMKQRRRTPYEVGRIRVDEATAVRYDNALHERYGRLNPNEKSFAKALDRLRLEWCRNPERSEAGYHIPLLQPDNGSYNFYPDFLVWKDDTVFAIDPKGDHILQGALRWKLMAIETPLVATQRVVIRLVSEGQYDEYVTRKSTTGYTVWSLRAGRPHPNCCDTIGEAVEACVQL